MLIAGLICNYLVKPVDPKWYMRRMKLRPGDFIRLQTRRGAIEIKVRSDRDVPEGMTTTWPPRSW